MDKAVSIPNKMLKGPNDVHKAYLLHWLSRAEGRGLQAEEDIVGLPIVALQLHTSSHMVPGSHCQRLL